MKIIKTNTIYKVNWNQELENSKDGKKKMYQSQLPIDSDSAEKNYVYRTIQLNI